MLVTVLWEDQRGEQAKRFGPHDLLLSSVADDLSTSTSEQPQKRAKLDKQIIAVPKRGDGNIRKALQKDLRRFRGPVIAVMDRDKVHRLWIDKRPPPSNCIQGISHQLRLDAPGKYDLVFLMKNTEDLLNATLAALGKAPLVDKPGPDSRDNLLAPAVWGEAQIRMKIRHLCPSFDRIVKVVGAHASSL
jgi:hypothetical protein